MKLIVGLGNPGARYERTRHNLGFLVVDRIAAQHSITLKKLFCEALVGEGVVDTAVTILAKPQTFMNRSGVAVGCLLRERAVAIEDMVVVNDDLDLPLGRIRIRRGGSAGGHRGLMSIIEGLSNAQFLRLRVGIGRPPESHAAVDYVLEQFSTAELAQVSGIVGRAADAVGCLLRDGAEQAMATYNRA